jgi:hypothetical protein
MGVTDPSTHGELAGDIIATSITTALANGVPIWRAVGNILDLYYEHKWIKITFDPSVNPYYLDDISVPYPPDTVSLQIDPLTDLPVAIWIKVDYGPLDWSKIWPADVAAIVSDPTFITSITNNETLITNITNLVVGAASSPTVASTLYTAKVPDAKLRTSCRGLLQHGEGVGFDLTWSRSPGALYTWQMNGFVVGESTLYSHLLISKTGGDDIMAAAGDRLLAWSSTPFGPDEPQAYGIYVVVNPGDLTHPAIIQRAPDANTPATICGGMTVQIDGPSNAEHNGDFFTLTTADPIVVDTTALTFSVSSSYTPTDKFELLTGPQLTSEGASNETLDMSWTYLSGDAEGPQSFITLAGTPGLSSLPAGLWTANLPEVYVDDDSTGVTVFKWKILKDDEGVGTDLFEIVSPPLTMSAVPMAPQYNQAADIPFGPTSKLVAIPVLSTTSPTPVTIFLRYSDPSHATWIKCPFALAMAGITPSGSIVVPLVDTYPTLSTTPVVPAAAQTVGDFDNLPTGSIPVELNGWAKADVGTTGTIAVMVGGTKDNPDGTTAATMTYTGTGAYTQILLQASVTNPGGKLPVKLAIASSDAAHVFFVQGLSIVIGTGSAGASSGGVSAAWGSITGTLSAQTDLASALAAKQATLVSGTNIKTVGGNSLLGPGDIPMGGGANPAMVRYISLLLG